MNENSMDASRDQRLDQILAAVQTLDVRVERVETKVDERLRETRPMWETVHAQLAEIKEAVQAETQSRHAQVSELRELVQAQVGELKESQQALRAEMEKSFRLLDRRMKCTPTWLLASTLTNEISKTALMKSRSDSLKDVG